MPSPPEVPPPPPARWSALYAGVALTALATLLLELALTRVFSVVFYYHFAFLAISIAMFGLGAGGVFSYWIGASSARLFARLGGLALLNAVLVVFALWLVLRPGIDLTNTRLAAVYLVTALPFLASGATLSLAISAGVSRVDRVYFFDLAGGSLGCLLLVPLLDHLGGPDTILAVAVLFSLSGVCWFRLAGTRAGAVAALVCVAGALALAAANRPLRFLDLSFAKGAPLSDEIYARWNSFSRIAVRWEKAWPNPVIVIDADANTAVATLDFEGWPADSRWVSLIQQASSLPYLLRPAAKTLIIGPGGGVDVAHALASGSRDITGVEINPIIVNDVMRERFAAVSRNLYHRPEVRIVVEDGRSFVRRSPERYQVLQATLVDTWASTAAGAFALSENNLYTTDAFVDYLGRLTDDGLLSFTRWGFEPPRESLRLVSLGVEALHRLGETDPARHFAVIREGTKEELEGIGARDTVLLARKPFSAADIRRLRELLALGKFQAVYLPGERIENAFTSMLLAADPKAWRRQYRYDVSPVSDNRPFFFYTVQPRDLANFLLRDSGAAVDYKINRAVPLLFGLFGISLLATLVILLLPPLVLGTRLPPREGVRFFLLYFAAIGAGYILVEVALIQKLVLLLGHPTYSLTVVIFTLLLASGLGSYFSRKIQVPVAVVAAVSALLGLAATPMVSACVGWPFAAKVASAVVLIAPLGFVMGMPFPTGLRLLDAWHAPAVRWAWSLNAAASVFGAVAALFVAIYLGLTQALLTGSLLYAAAAIIRRRATMQLAR